MIGLTPTALAANPAIFDSKIILSSSFRYIFLLKNTHH